MSSDAITLKPTRPAPRPDEASQAFFDGLRRGELLVQQCESCAMHQLARSRCLRCDSAALKWVPASGRATLHAFATVCANPGPEFNEGRPYNIAIVALHEGPQIYANVIHCDSDHLRIGMPLTVVMSPIDGGEVVPVFEPESGKPPLKDR